MASVIVVIDVVIENSRVANIDCLIISHISNDSMLTCMQQTAGVRCISKAPESAPRSGLQQKNTSKNSALSSERRLDDQITVL